MKIDPNTAALNARIGLWLLLFSSGWGAGTTRGAESIYFSDVTAQSGIGFVHTDGGSGRRYIVETVSAGLALFDYDGDGRVDIYFLNGAPLPGTVVKRIPRHALYRNEGSFRFRDVTAEAGVGNTGFGLGVTVGDFDNDGDADLYLNNFGPNVFYRNNGDGTFADVTATTGSGNGDQVGAGTCFLDADLDGDLDLFVSSYLVFSCDAVGPTLFRGVPVYPAPEVFPPAANALLRNEGDGSFVDVSRESGIGVPKGWGMGTVGGDYDNDGDTDIFVANDANRNFLFDNRGGMRFEEVGLLAGVAYDAAGRAQGNMGAACGDYDNDGWLDFYVTSYQCQPATLYRNLGAGLFDDVTRTSGAGEGTYHSVTWGTDFVDLDHDGLRDIFVACGHLMDLVEQFDDTTSYHARNVVLKNVGGGKFVDVSREAGPGLDVCLSSRGAGFDDLDNDGDVDVVVLNSRRESTVLRNGLAAGSNWLHVSLVGRIANRDGVGARVRVTAGDLVLIDEVHSGRGYQSHYGSRLYFGLGSRNRVERLEVRWPGGISEVYQDLPANRRLLLVEGAGQRLAEDGD